MATVAGLFWSRGYAGTSMDAIATATGLGKGSLYGAFGGKRDLYLRVLGGYCAEVTDAASVGLAGPDDGAFARLCAHIRSAAQGIGADHAHHGCLLAKAAAELSEHDHDVAEQARRTFEGLADLLTADIEAAQREGELDATADAGALARFVLSVLRGMEALGKGGVDAEWLDDAAETTIRLLPRTAHDAGTGSTRSGEAETG
ncbi:TetR/AcrR family transcriptional regulator [Serinicoccus kebangsaanensis]|uniref:TetR/AcrR family transcriptional regulator n=1 Tax=Serinicoccus kebangsaanensis TaxID=2602069 RepID=UPI00192D9E2D|nr:TetR/AcrR family transcriptional regulator [Serinicoccus kebangsaanensis]